MADDPKEPIELYRARWADEGQAFRAELEAAGVPALVDSELLQGIAGEVPGGLRAVMAVTCAPSLKSLDLLEVLWVNTWNLAARLGHELKSPRLPRRSFKLDPKLADLSL